MVYLGRALPTIPMLALLLALPSPVAACLPSYIPNVPLWIAIRDAELIVAGEIDDIDLNKLAMYVDELGSEAESFLSDQGIGVDIPEIVASAAIRVKVTESLEGTSVSKVTFRLLGIYSDDVSSVSKPAVFFLRREVFSWRLTGYPIPYRSKQELDDLRFLVKKAVAAKGSPAFPGNPAYVDWLVEATARSVTRFQAARQLGREGALSPEAQRRLAAAFVADPTPDEALPEMIWLLRYSSDTEVVRVIQERIDALRETDTYLYERAVESRKKASEVSS